MLKLKRYLAAVAIPLATLLDYVFWNVFQAREHGRITWRQSWSDNVSYWRVHF